VIKGSDTPITIRIDEFNAGSITANPAGEFSIERRMSKRPDVQMHSTAH